MATKRGGNGKVHPDKEPKLPVPIRTKARPHVGGGEDPEVRTEPPPPPGPRPRRGTVQRRTRETEVSVALDLDGSGRCQVETGIPFFDHMLESLAKHSLIDLKVIARGDTEVDPHHTVEDVGLCIGRALVDAVGDRAGLVRYGAATIPFDEALIRCAVDLSGRPAFVYRVVIPAGRVGSFDVELAEVFFGALAAEGRMNLHLILEYGQNRHHIIEGCFKAFARALERAVLIDPRRNLDVPSTKGRLD
jgi:imidazoleglycerol-phosphate dehydratase